jgi:CDP-diacylglycerol--glycerol-3-phosphate 3-phosphatidyltransferase
MEGSIIRTVLFNFLLQLSILIISAMTGQADLGTLYAYGGASAVLHVLIGVFLYVFRSDFFNLSTNQPLSRINPANRVTLLRISSLPTIAFLLNQREVREIKILLPVLLALVFLTDAFDGQIARRKKQITRMGQMLDSISDYSLLGVISIVYYIHEILPAWFFLLVFFRLFLQGLGMLVFIMLKKPLETKSTWGGKITVATIMTLYLLEILGLYLPKDLDRAFTLLEYACGAVIFTLSFEKARLFFRQSKKISA